MTAHDMLLPGGREVPFADIEATLARLVRDGRRRKGTPARALTATVVVVGTSQRLAPAAEALERLSESDGVRSILISEGTHTSPVARITESSIAIGGLAPRFLNNAVAALRLSSLPTLVWWRGGTSEALEGMANLADRLVLDTEDPTIEWDVAGTLFEKTALTDFRWPRLTRWRATLAHLYDLPQVRSAKISRLCIEASDPFAARLFAGWLRSSLHWGSNVAIDIQRSSVVDHRSPLDTVTLDGGSTQIALSVHPSRSCLRAAVGIQEAARVVPMFDGTLTSFIAEELAVRTRDLAFERALTSALEIQAWA